MATRMLQRRGTAAEWAAENPILADGEMGFETDSKIIKMGDGVTPWADLGLPYLTTGGGTMTGALTLIAPTLSSHAARLAEVDALSDSVDADVTALSTRIDSQVAQGVLDYAETATGQTGITTVTDLTGLSVSVDVPAGRALRVTVKGEIQQQGANGVARGRIQEGATGLNNWIWATLSVGVRTSGQASAIVFPAAGVHTYKATLDTSSGSVDLISGSDRIAFIVVEDVGPAPV